GWLHDNSVAAGESWGDFPREQKQWKVPRSDDPNHSDRFSYCIVQCTAAIGCFGLVRLIACRLDQISKGAKIRGRTRHIEPRSERNGFARICHFGSNETIEA